MTCDLCRERIWDYCAGDLPADEAASVEAHLAECASCRQAESEVRRICEAASGLTHADEDRALWLQTKEAIREELGRQGRGDAAFGPVMNADDLARYLKVDVSVIYRRLDEIPHFELEGTILFRRESVDAWLSSMERGQSLFFVANRAVS